MHHRQSTPYYAVASKDLVTNARVSSIASSFIPNKRMRLDSAVHRDRYRTPVQGVDYSPHPEAAAEWGIPTSPFHWRQRFINNFSIRAARILFPESE